MSGETRDSETVPVDETDFGPVEVLITGQVVIKAMAGGLAGTVLMLPVLVGVPGLLGFFQTQPITEFAGFAGFFGIEPTLPLGIALFGVGGTIVLPLMFVVVGSFLPPENPRFLRGATLATFAWFGFLPAFWPDGNPITVGLFVVFSLLAHWIYGVTLGYVLDRTTGIPQHEV